MTKKTPPKLSELKIELIPINQLKENPTNPRIIKDHRYEKLVQSIKDFPEMLELRPVIYRKDGIVLGGNMRLKASLEAGLNEIWAMKATQLNEAQQKEFIIKDNLGYGEWDWEMIATQWDADELANWGMEGPGFEVKEEDMSEEFSLASGEKAPFTQMTFTLATAQAELLKAALEKLKASPEIDKIETFGNENSNGNALHLLYTQWAEQKKSK